MKTLIEVFGWYGMVAIVVTYALVSFSVLTPTNIWYQILNGTSALGIVVVSFYKRAYQPGVLNVIWILIAIAAILKIVF